MRFLLASLLSALCFFSTVYSAEWKNESELGIAVAQGNTKTKNYNAKQTSSVQVNAHIFKINARYLSAYSNSVESARYLLGAIRYERELNQKFSVYVGQGFESDKFAGYDLRQISDLGGKYNFYKEDNFYWFAEAGYRYTNEERLNGSHDYQNALRAYTETEKKWNANVSTKYWFEYVPNLNETKDYLVNTELSLSAALSGIFSVKTGFLLRYDNLPAPGTVTKTDSLFTTALVAKF